MVGLIVLAIFIAYLALAILVVWQTKIYARNHGKSVARWGWGAALLMFLIPFWDWLPTIVAHEYYCTTEAGFWVYKTPEQWKEENPGVLEILTNRPGAPHQRQGDNEKYIYTYFLNDRFNWIVSREGRLFPNRWRHEQQLVDSLRGEVLARYIDFSTSQVAPMAGWAGWKLWLANGHCPIGQRNDSAMREFKNKFLGKKSQ